MSRKLKRSYRKSSRKISRKSVKRSRRVSASRRKCNKILSDKIRVTMDEYKSGRFVSRAQAIAVAYSTVNKKYPKCRKFFSRK